MAIYRNMYSRHKLTIGFMTRWCLSIIVSYLYMSSCNISCTKITEYHHGRHHNHHRGESVESDNIKKSKLDHFLSDSDKYKEIREYDGLRHYFMDSLNDNEHVGRNLDSSKLVSLTNFNKKISSSDLELQLKSISNSKPSDPRRNRQLEHFESGVISYLRLGKNNKFSAGDAARDTSRNEYRETKLQNEKRATSVKQEQYFDYPADDPGNYPRDGEFRDYESEDPRPHMFLKSPIKSQVEKSVLEKEHTSQRPASTAAFDSPHRQMQTDTVTRRQSTRHIVQVLNISTGASVYRTKPRTFVQNRDGENLKSISSHDNLNESFTPSSAHFHPHNVQCPTCYSHYVSNHEKSFNTPGNNGQIDSETIRLDAIKRQILNKLGLKQKPVIKKKLPKEVILQSLYRAEEDGIKAENSQYNDHRIIKHVNIVEANSQYYESSSANPNDGTGSTSTSSTGSNEVQDDFYARTSEIIIFSESGATINSQQLIEFSLNKYSDTGEQELKIKAATLWVEASFNETIDGTERLQAAHHNVTLWVFRVIREGDITDRNISNQEFDKNMEMVTSIKIPLSSLGWLKFDITKTVKEWYERILAAYSPNHDEFKSSENFRSAGNDTLRATQKQFLDNDNNYESEPFSAEDRKTNQYYEDDLNYNDNEQKVHSRKLRLFIDCSGCKDLVQIHLFSNSKNDGKRVLKQKNNNFKNRSNEYDAYKYNGYINDQGSNINSMISNDNNNNRPRNSNTSQPLQDMYANSSHTYNRYSNHERQYNNSTEPDASNADSHQNDDISTEDVKEVSNRPFLIIYTDPNIMKRVRRRALDCSGALRGQCCKQKFYVNFETLGWGDWVIAPLGYYANYCMGSCSGVHRTPDTFLNYYTNVIHEYQRLGDLKGLQPCCAPVKFSSTSLIYYSTDSNIIKRDLPKMTVEECGCP